MKRLHVLQLAALAAVFVSVYFGVIDPATACVLFIGMAQPADSLSVADLKNVEAGGLVAEDVLRQIYDISEGIPTPFLDMIGDGSVKNTFSEWTEDELAPPDLNNAVIDGADIVPVTQATGARVGNHTQICTKGVNVSEGSEHTDNFGRTLAYRTMREIKQLRRDREAIALSNQASVADNGTTTAGRTGGFGAWIETNSYSGTGGAAGGFNTTTKLVDATTPGEARALTWEMLADAIEASYTLGANPTVAMSVPALTKRLGRYLFGTPYAASPVQEVSGSTPTTQVSQGYIDTFRTDFGFTMKIVPNRLQQVYDSGDVIAEDVADLFGIDPEYVDVASLWGVKVEPLAKTGLSTRRMISTSWMVRPKLERAHFVIHDLDPTAAVSTGP